MAQILKPRHSRNTRNQNFVHFVFSWSGCSMRSRMGFACVVLAASVASSPRASTAPVLMIEDYLEMPMTGVVDGKTTNEVLLSRVNTLREEVGGANRLFISDLNGPLYIFDKATKRFTTYLDFNGHPGKDGLFKRLFILQGYGNGLNGFYLDPEYTKNGKFYTTHIEDPSIAASNLPDNTRFPGLNVSGYTTTAAIRTPGPIQN